MSMVYPSFNPDPLGPLVERLRNISRRLDELEAPSGTSLAGVLSRVTAATELAPEHRARVAALPAGAPESERELVLELAELVIDLLARVAVLEGGSP